MYYATQVKRDCVPAWKRPMLKRSGAASILGYLNYCCRSRDGDVKLLTKTKSIPLGLLC